MTSPPKNSDQATVEGFGREWTAFTQSEANLSAQDRRAMFEGYFSIFPWDALPPDSIGADIGCGSGRWALLVAPRVGHLHAIDAAAEALVGRARQSRRSRQCQLSPGLGVGACRSRTARSISPIRSACCITFPTPRRRLRDIAAKLKRGAPFLVYLYYAFDNRSAFYRMLWRISNTGRLILSRAPYRLQIAATTVIAYTGLLADRAPGRAARQSSECCRARGRSPITATARST